MSARPIPNPPIQVARPRNRRLNCLVTFATLLCAVTFPCVVESGAQAAGVRPAEAAGAATIGTARYPVPTSQVVFASPTGSDSARGSMSAPVRTIKRALALVPARGTIVLRRGTYHETVTVSSKTVTIQNYPGEAVWLDGAQAVTGWVASGSVWRKARWNHMFDHSPTFTSGQADGTASWKFVNPAHPMASHPDQLWVNGAAMTQVRSKAQVRPGTFFYDRAGKNLYLGTNPNGRRVEASTLSRALEVRSPKVVVRGLGIRRYATSVPAIGAVTLERPGIRLENVSVIDGATSGIAVTSTDATLRKVTVDNNGLRGISGNYADRLTLDAVRVTNNNSQHFNHAPSAAGLKTGRTQGLTVKNSRFANNDSTGLWTDVSTSNSVITGNDFENNRHHGVSLEVSATSVVADNQFIGNTDDGLLINDTQSVQVWNNTFVRNARAIEIVQDQRHASDPEDAHNLDPRRPKPDPRMTWNVGPVTVSNNVIALPKRSDDWLLVVKDATHKRSAAQMRVKANGDVYNRISSFAIAVVWSKGAGNPAVFRSIGAFKSATGQEANSVAVDGRAIVSATGVLDPSVASKAGSIARPLPTTVASHTGRTAGTKVLGTFTSR